MSNCMILFVFEKYFGQILFQEDRSLIDQLAIWLLNLIIYQFYIFLFYSLFKYQYQLQQRQALLKMNDKLISSLKRPAPNIHQEYIMQSDAQSFDEQNELVKVKIGRIPYGWYDEFKHFGYDKNLQKVSKASQEDKLQQFIQKSQNKDWWRMIKDQLNQRSIRLNDHQLQLIDRIRSGKMASKTLALSQYNFQHDYCDPFPIHSNPPAKRNFMPSKWQQMKINKILSGLLTGRIKWNKDQQRNIQDKQLYDAWASKQTENSTINIAPMKQKLPGHNESYNPSKQYLLNSQELKQWMEMDQEDRPFNFVPTSFSKMRHIPLYDKLIQQKFQRCLDLYLCPRIKKKRLNIDPDILVPKLPDSSTLRPFPTIINISYVGHKSQITTIVMSPDGIFMASGDESGLIIIWQVSSSKILWRKHYKEVILSIDWSINNMIAFSHGQSVQIMIWKYNIARALTSQQLVTDAKVMSATNPQQLKWIFYHQSTPQYKEGLRICFSLDSDITHIQFQKSKGDYFLSVSPDSQKKNEVVAVHRISKAASQTNFIKGSGIFKKVSFYPKKPYIIILTGGKVVIFDLQQLVTVKKLSSGDNTYSTMSVHPSEPYIMVGSQNSKIHCFDLDLSSKPYKSMAFHQKTVTSIDYHQRYPLMASASADATIHIFHFKGQSQTLQEALILPLKVLRGHTIRSLQGVKCIKFHPVQPWLVSGGADGKILMWT